MGILRDLVGDLTTISNEELEKMVQTGRLAREDEADEARVRGGKKGGGGGKKKSVLDNLPAINLDDFD